MPTPSRSKYDNYWLSRIDEIHNAMLEALKGKIAVIDIREIDAIGNRLPASWIGKTIICPDGVVIRSSMAHVKSLTRILLETTDFSNYDICFSFRTTKNLELIIERTEKEITIYKNKKIHEEKMYSNKENYNMVNSVFRKAPFGKSCICDNVFKDFLWSQLDTLNYKLLPAEPGVYVVRIIGKGDDVAIVRRNFQEFIIRSKWKELASYMDSRLDRLYRISTCPLLYIGSTESIRSRFRELAGQRHTVFFPVLALLLGGWKLDYGFKTVGTKEEARRLEERLKQEYVKIHDKLPALVDR